LSWNWKSHFWASVLFIFQNHPAQPHLVEWTEVSHTAAGKDSSKVEPLQIQLRALALRNFAQLFRLWPKAGESWYTAQAQGPTASQLVSQQSAQHLFSQDMVFEMLIHSN
jgi:hypothetical protein